MYVHALTLINIFRLPQYTYMLWRFYHSISTIENEVFKMYSWFSRTLKRIRMWDVCGSRVYFTQNLLFFLWFFSVLRVPSTENFLNFFSSRVWNASTLFILFYIIVSSNLPFHFLSLLLFILRKNLIQ